MFPDTVKEKLVKKQNDLIMHQIDLRQQKREFNSSMNEQIKECAIKIECLAKALNQGQKEFLNEGFNGFEIESFYR